MNRALLSGLIAALLLTACDKPLPETRAQFLALGTLVDVTVRGVDDQRAAQLIGDVEKTMLQFQSQWDAWGDGELGQLNAGLGSQQCVSLSPELNSALERAWQLSRQSHYRFDPTLGELVELWHFHRDDEFLTQPPAAENIQTWLAERVNVADVTLRDGHIEAARALRIDLGGFAKGLAVEHAIALLQDAGVENAIVNTGGDLKVIGSAEGRPWRIGIRNPRDVGILASVTLQDGEAIFTSGDYERFFDYQGQRYHHILDPSSGYPTRGFTSVTVLHRDAALADAAATALMVAGPEHWQETAKTMQVDTLMLVPETGIIVLTPSMAERVQFETELTATPQTVTLP